MKRAVDELVWHNKVRRLVLFLERSYGGNGEYPLDAQALHAVNVGAKIDLRRKDAVSASMPRQKCHLASLERTQNVDVRSFAERRLHRDFMNVGKAGHGIQTAATNNADFCLLQKEFSCINLRQIDDW